MPLIDPVASINRVFLEGTRMVPYPLFMTCFNKLLKEPSKLDPRQPSEELKEYFRAVCMAIDLGIADPSGRGEDRKKEFFNSIYPVWKQGLPESDFQRYQEILGGIVRRHRLEEFEEARRRQAEETRKAMGEAAEAAAKPGRPLFADLTSAALEADEGDQPAAPAPGRRAAPGPPLSRPAELSELEAAAIDDYNSIDDLVDSMSGGETKMIEYSDRTHRRPFARYVFQGENVTIQLVKSGNSYYMLMSYPRGYVRLPGAAEAVKETLTGMGYQQLGPFFYERIQGELAFKVNVGAHSTNLAEKRSFPFTIAALTRAMEQLHGTLDDVIAELERKLRKTS